MEIGLQACQARFRAIEPAHRLRGGGHADLGEARGMFAELADRLLVQVPQLAPLMLDDTLQVLHPDRSVLLRARLGRTQIVQTLLQLADDLGVPFAGHGKSIDDLGRLLGQLRQTMLDRLQPLLAFVPEMERQTQPIDLRLEFDEASFEIGTVL